MWSADLLDDAQVHHRDPVREAECLDLVVGDENDGDPGLPLQQLDFQPHLFPKLGVEIAEGLVQQEHGGLVDERSSESDSLLLSTAEHRGRPLLQAGKSHQFQCPGHTFLDRAALLASDFQWESDVVLNGHVRPDSVGLEHHPHVAAVRRHGVAPRGVNDDPVLKEQLALVNRLKTCNHPERGGLSTSARAQQGEHLSVENVQTDVFDGGDRVSRICLGHLLETYRWGAISIAAPCCWTVPLIVGRHQLPTGAGGLRMMENLSGHRASPEASRWSSLPWMPYGAGALGSASP